MKNELVKYHNDFNEVNFSKYSNYEQNLLFKILLEVKEKGAQVIEIPYTDLMIAFNGQFKNNVEIGEYLLTLKKNFFEASYTMTTKNERGLVGFTTFLLFNNFTFFYDEPEKKPKSQWKNFEVLEVQVNSRFAYLINDLTKNFTTFELGEFVALNGKYTKSLYRLLKQYRTQGIAPLQPMPIDEFRRVIGIPEKKYNWRQLERQILNPAIKELSEPALYNKIPFNKLQCLKFDKNKKPVSDEVIRELDEKTNKKRRRAVRYIQFTFTPENSCNTTNQTTTEAIDVVVNSKKQTSSDEKQTTKINTNESYLKQFVDNLTKKYKYKELIYNGKKEICVNFEFDSLHQDVIVFFESGLTLHVKNSIDLASKCEFLQ